MALANELSSEIAAAILASRERSGLELEQLKEIVIRVHLALQDLASHQRSSLEEASDETDCLPNRSDPPSA